MKRLRPLLGAAMLAACALGGVTACALPPDAPTVLASANGTGPGDAYVVYSPQQRDEVFALLGLASAGRELHVIDGRAFDVLRAVDPETKEAREVWFDISRFFNRS
ncbi:hypothetical protein [Alteraurantiacibacter aquimixticola]|uniref:Uncharacterized protein n=1 Tax=Alteraurantiacibacter aquimixticola TaxID=2489173 RepID=A0A4T3F0R0_9SPHN|nr:hypothetical protein [Alteraurantiacibacter aquimixticola]TIX50524.1 hypothetical protein E5222_09655 [Alteraurantiacibacter aquimixticola]